MSWAERLSAPSLCSLLTRGTLPVHRLLGSLVVYRINQYLKCARQTYKLRYYVESVESTSFLVSQPSRNVFSINSHGRTKPERRKVHADRYQPGLHR